jgi:uncharacterized protein YggE
MQKENFNFGLNTLYKSLTILAAILCIVAIIYAINLYKEGKIIGSNGANIITVAGKGEVNAKPDMSSINLTLRESGADAKTAENKVSIKSEKFLSEIKTLIEDRDIKTENYNSQPKYNYGVNNNYGNPKIEGYEVSQSIILKVRDIKNVSEVLDMISSNNIGEVSGPNFEIDDVEKYKDEARGVAIKDAKDKAEKLAEQLGVSIVRMTSFSEGSDYIPTPYMRTEKSAVMSMDAAMVPSIPVGENTISSNVNITFEIK